MDKVLHHIIFASGLIAFLTSCTAHEEETLFVSRSNTGIDFNNDLSYTQEVNPYTYRNFYNGAGVAIGDLDNDGWEDVYFTGNLVDNQLYKNLGDFKFDNVTSLSRTSCSDSWSTGVSFVDINNDNLLDIYVCKSGPPTSENRANELFINKGNFRFEEQAHAYGLDIKGFSVQASFFDFDKDGDLDCYLLNNSIKSVGGYDLRPGLRNQPTTDGNMLLVNSNGKFENKSSELGIYTSSIGFGLGVNTSDMNDDGWPDIYVANDFFEKDYFYINQNGEGFQEVGEQYFNSFSMGSMGVDVADIDSDGDQDVFVAEMAPQSLERQKTKAVYENWDKYQKGVRSGYHHQFARNMLHLSDGAHYREVSRSLNIDATDWSWAPLIFDMDNDGFKDLFISNGIGKDLLDRDYLAFMANERRVSELLANRDQSSLKKLIDILPSEKVSNAFFLNNANKSFDRIPDKMIYNVTPTFSNATAIADLDRDGDLDMIISNIDDKATLLENKAKNNFISIQLIGEQYSDLIGSQLKVFYSDKVITHSINPYRGFQSTVTTQAVIGIGKADAIDSIVVNWPDGKSELYISSIVNEFIQLKKGKGNEITRRKQNFPKLQLEVQATDSIHYNYPLRQFNEFNKEKLLLRMMPSLGPIFAIDNASKTMIMGGAHNHPIELIDINSALKRLDTDSFESSLRKYVSDITLIDGDKDGDLDVLVSHGHRIFSQYSTELNDQYYINDGGVYTLDELAIVFEEPIMTSDAVSGDINGDGHDDLIIAEGVHKDVYGLPTELIYLENSGRGHFADSARISLDGMASHVSCSDIDQDGSIDILICGEWLGIKVYGWNEGSGFYDKTDILGLSQTRGLWQDIVVLDIDGDGDKDIIGANQGTNSVYSPSLKMYVNDFDRNGRTDQITTLNIRNKDYPIHDFDEIISQLPGIRNKVSLYADYAVASITDLFETSILDGSIVHELDEVRSGIFINEGGNYLFQAFPEEVQSSSMHAISTGDINDDGIRDIIIGGNHFLYKPQFGRDDASRGWVLIGTRENEKYFISEVMELGVSGEIRKIDSVGDNEFWIGVNGEPLKKYSIKYVK